MFDSFKYMFSDKNFIKKYFLVLIFVFIANLFMNWSGVYAPVLNNGETSVWYYALYIIGFVIMFVPFGYSIEVLRHTLSKDAGNELPTISVLQNFLNGLKVIMSGTLLILALFVVFYIFGLLNSIFSGTLGDVVSSVILTLSMLILFFSSFFGIVMCCRYVIKPSYFNFVNFKAAIRIVDSNILKYLKAYFKTVLLAVIVYGLSMILVTFLVKLSYAGLVIYAFLVSVIWTYVLFVLAKIFAKAIDVDKI